MLGRQWREVSIRHKVVLSQILLVLQCVTTGWVGGGWRYQSNNKWHQDSTGIVSWGGCSVARASIRARIERSLPRSGSCGLSTLEKLYLSSSSSSCKSKVLYIYCKYIVYCSWTWDGSVMGEAVSGRCVCLWIYVSQRHGNRFVYLCTCVSQWHWFVYLCICGLCVDRRWPVSRHIVRLNIHKRCHLPHFGLNVPKTLPYVHQHLLHWRADANNTM